MAWRQRSCLLLLIFLALPSGHVHALTQINTFTALKMAEGDKMATGSGTRTLVPADRYSSTYWRQNLMSTFHAPTFKRIRNHVCANVIVTTLMYLAFAAYPSSTLLKGIPVAPHLLLGNALGLLLVFRTNSAYDRFWEARKIWGAMISRIRILAHFAHRSLYGAEREHVLTMIAAMPAVFLHHLRGWNRLPKQQDQVDFLVQALGEDDAILMWKAGNRPLLLCKMIGAVIHRSLTNSTEIEARLKAKNGDGKGGQLSNLDVAIAQAELISQRRLVDDQLVQLVDAVGGAERIVKTTVPVSYSRHTSRFLSIWCFTLPAVLLEALGWRLIPVMFIVCWSLFTIEEVGHIIEDPFNMPQPNPMDDMKFEGSFKVVREDVMERLPASDPLLEVNGGDRVIPWDYDVSDFHEYYIERQAKEQAKNQVRESVAQVDIVKKE